MVTSCYFSKWAEAITLPNQTAATTADALYKTIIQRHGLPKVIVSDRNFVNNLRFGFQRARIENEKARAKQKFQYVLDVKVVRDGDSRKFTSFYRGPFRVTRVYKNNTVDICDSSYRLQRVHINRLNALPDSMIWGEEECPSFGTTDTAERENS